MLTNHLSTLYSRDLTIVKEEIAAYTTEEALWRVPEGISNSAGNLSLHISGNLQHFFGAAFGHTNYKRDRDFEFSGKVTKQQLLDDLQAAESSVLTTLKALDDQQLSKNHPFPFREQSVTTAWFFLHLYSHLSYHLGQINYHRRLTDT